MRDPSADRPEIPRESFDRIALDLQHLRESAGPVSYAELVRRITALRLQRGIHTAAAVPARSTVYNAFTSGRTRMDTDLLRDIVLALGATTDEADEWVRRCRDARRAGEAKVDREVVEPKKPTPAPVLRPPEPQRLPMASLLVLLVTLVIVNHASHWSVAAALDLPIYLDMIGTAVAAIALGPWYGVAVALATGLTGPLLEEGILAFTLVNVAGALVWGYGIRRFRLGRDVSGFFLLNIVVACACSLVATPILVVLWGGAYGSIGRIADSLEGAGMPFIVATFTSNISTSILDKLLTGFISLAIFAVLHRRMGLSASHMPLIERLAVLRPALPATAPRPWLERWNSPSPSFRVTPERPT